MHPEIWGVRKEGSGAKARTAARTTQRHMEANLFRADMEKGRGTEGRGGWESKGPGVGGRGRGAGAAAAVATGGCGGGWGGDSACAVRESVTMGERE